MAASASRVASETPEPEGGITGKPGRRAYTRALYDALVVGYRLAPGNAAHAGRVAGCERRCALRAWEHGWRGLPWARPIREVLAEETQAARARVAEQDRMKREGEDARREQARVEGIEAESQERSMLRAARQDVLASAVVAAELVPAMRGLAAIVKSAVLDANGKPLPNPTIDAKSAIIMISRWTGIVGKVVYAAEVLAQLGRTERGLANTIVGHAEIELSPEQTEDELVAGVELLARIRGVDAGKVASFLDELQGRQPGDAGVGARVEAHLALPAHSLGEATDGSY